MGQNMLLLSHAQPPSITQWAPDTHKASTPCLSGFGLSPMQHSTNVEQPVDTLIDGLIKGQETFFLGLEAKID